MLSHRLQLGPVLIALLALLAWLDARLERVAAPEFLAVVLGDTDTLPPGVVVYLTLVAVCAAASWELARMLRAAAPAVSGVVVITASLLGLTAASLEAWGRSPGSGLVLAAGALAVLLPLGAHARTRSTDAAAQHAGGAALGFVYLGLIPAAFVAIRQEHAAGVLLVVLLVVKSCDIGAYAVGMTIGKHKLIPWLSPGKTWEGLLGGIATATLVAAASAAIWGDEHGYTIWAAAIGGAVLGLVGQVGDLLASLLKRGTGVKNSGRVPGFGGVLDLLDSPLLAAPAALWLLRMAS